MSTYPNMVFLIKRSGEDGKLGPFEDALQVVKGSPIVEEYCTNRNYYEGSIEEYEAFWLEKGQVMVAGDVDGDGDRDSADRAIVEDIQEANG